MAHTEEKLIAKEIIIKMIETRDLVASDFPEAKTNVDVVCQAFSKVLDTIMKNPTR